MGDGDSSKSSRVKSESGQNAPKTRIDARGFAHPSSDQIKVGMEKWNKQQGKPPGI